MDKLMTVPTAGGRSGRRETSKRSERHRPPVSNSALLTVTSPVNVSHSKIFTRIANSMPSRWLGPRGFGGAVVADEDELAGEVDHPVGQRQLGSRYRLGLHTELVTARGRQGGQVGIGDDRPRVVAVVAGAEIREELGLVPWAEDEVRLDVGARLRDACRSDRPRRVDPRVHVVGEDVAPRARDEAQPRQRHDVELDER